ncbi:MAG: hypothetical protein K8S55_15030 [Phycisphaerae bacterium]|nr:hypothetical protein [Phycisphaerae bacterium]
MRNSLRYIGLIVLTGLLFAGGCVSKGQAEAFVHISDYGDGKVLDDCLLLTIGSEGTEKKGYWWVAQEAKTGAMVVRRADVKLFNSGEKLKQPGKVVMLLGPYVTSTPVGWEYWFFRKGYRVERLYDDRLERRYSQEKPVKITMIPFKPGDPSNDERTLDAARKVLIVTFLMDNTDAPTVDMAKLLLNQLRRIGKVSHKSKDRKTATEFIGKLEAFLKEGPPPENKTAGS